MAHQHSSAGFARRALLAGGVALAFSDRAFAASRRLGTIGLITGTIRKPLQEDPDGTLQKIAAYGYRELEFTGAIGGSIDECKALLRKHGLRAIAGGHALGGLTEKLDETIAEARALRKRYVVCYWPGGAKAMPRPLSYWRDVGAKLNQLGRKVKGAGLQLAYHNHDLEFAETEGEIPYDVLLAATDPKLVTMELDVYWITKGGRDAATYLAKHPGRYSLLHVKDMARDGDGMACVGEGRVDFARVLARARRAGVKHYIVEHDNPTDPLACAQSSLAHLRKLRF